MKAFTKLDAKLAPLPLAEQAARAARFRPGDDTADVLRTLAGGVVARRERLARSTFNRRR